MAKNRVLRDMIWSLFSYPITYYEKSKFFWGNMPPDPARFGSQATQTTSITIPYRLAPPLKNSLCTALTPTYQQLIGILNKAESEAADGAALVSELLAAKFFRRFPYIRLGTPGWFLETVRTAGPINNHQGPET